MTTCIICCLISLSSLSCQSPCRNPSLWMTIEPVDSCYQKTLLYCDLSSHASSLLQIQSALALRLLSQFEHQFLGCHDRFYQQQQLKQQLQSFWANQYQEIEKVNDFKNHNLPLARIKKTMKADENVRMISAEAPIVFARACEMFILELTLRSWNHTEENKRRTLQKNDIAAAITEDLKDEALASIPRGTVPVGGPTDAYPYYYMPAQHSPQGGAPGMIVGQPVMDPVLYAQQPHSYMAQQMWPQNTIADNYMFATTAFIAISVPTF
ncbi:hypothetical protein ACSBR2_018104 [Camellia fascicularis]